MPSRLLALALLTQGPALAAWDGPPVLLVTSEFPPYVFCTPTPAGDPVPGGQRGADVLVVEELFRRAEIPFVVRCLPWKRALGMAQVGQVAAVFPGFRTPEREQFALFLEHPLHRSEYAVFVRRGEEFSFAGPADLAGRRVAVERGHDISPAFHAAVRDRLFPVEESSSPEQSLRKLVAGRVDAYINNRAVVLHSADALELLGRVAALPVAAAQDKPSFLLIARAGPLGARPDRVRRLDDLLREMWRDGTVARLTGQVVPQPHGAAAPPP